MKTERNSEGVPPASYQLATQVTLRGSANYLLDVIDFGRYTGIFQPNTL
jgi:hypothetical protein